MIKFYDTCSLLLAGKDAFNSKFVISSITLNELEKIKTSNSKDPEVKFQARELTRLLDENQDKYEVWIYKNSMITPIENADLEITNDTKILSGHLYFS